MTCDPETLIRLAKCYECVPPGMWGSILTNLMVSWANSAGPPAPVLYWVPDTARAFWTDGAGNHTGNLATFQATADYPTVTVLTFNIAPGTDDITEIHNLRVLTSIVVCSAPFSQIAAATVDHCPTLQGLNLGYSGVGGTLAALDLTGNTGLINLYIGPHNIPVLDISPCAPSIVNCIAQFGAFMTEVITTNCASLLDLEVDWSPNCSILDISTNTNVGVLMLGCEGDAFPTPTVDDMFSHLVAFGWPGGTFLIDLGTNGPPTNDCNPGTDCDILTVAGWTILTN